jgi:hypothetical protein
MRKAISFIGNIFGDLVLAAIVMSLIFLFVMLIVQRFN